jgi:AcrR family transcriptional regulator
MSGQRAGALRADAEDNRRRIIDRSRELFSSRGLDVPMKAIATGAEVGMATLYRHFPTRQDLMREVFAGQFEECAAIIEAAVADPDPWSGLCAVVQGLTSMQAADRGFSAAFVQDLPDQSVVENKLRSGMQGVQDIIVRARKAGQLRPDFAFEDLILLLLANGGVVSQGGVTASVNSRRLVAYMLESFHSERVPRQALPPAPRLSMASVGFPQ